MATATTTTAVARRPIDGIRAMLLQSEKQIAMALPKHMTAERMIRVALTTIQRTPKLLECSPLSLVGGVVQASELGLELNGFLGEAYLVPYWNSKARSYEAQFQAGYRGLISLARRSGQVALVYSELVYNCDKFKVSYGLNKNLEHEPDLENPERGTRDNNGDLIGLRGAYAVVKFKDGEFDFEYLPLTKLNELRARSKSKSKDGDESGPWVTDPDQMYRKVPIRQLAKRLPLSPEFQKAAVLDEYGEAGVRQNLGAEIIANATNFEGALSDIAQNKSAELRDKYAKPREAETEAHTTASGSTNGSATATQHDPSPAEGNESRPSLYDEAEANPSEPSATDANQHPETAGEFNPFAQTSPAPQSSRRTGR